MKLRRSQVQSTFASSVGDRCHASCVAAATAVEYNGVDAGGLGALGNELADLARLGGLVTVEGAQICFERGCEGQRVTLGVIDDLDEDVRDGGPWRPTCSCLEFREP